MNELQIFNNPKFGDLRTVREPDGSILFCGVDVARMLKYVNAKEAIKRHCKGVVKRALPTNSGVQEANFVPVGDIYRLAARSQLDGAEEFESWIFDEIVPTVMHTGTYTVQPLTTAEQLVAQAQLLLDMEKELKAVTERVETAETFAIEAGAKAEQAVQKLDTAIKVYSRPDKDHWVEDMELAIRELATSDGWGEVRLRGQLYRELELSAHKDISARLKRLRDRKRQAGMTYKEAAALTKLDAIAASKELRLIFEGIVKRHQAQAGDITP